MSGMIHTYTLKQITPIIHFQHEEEGVTLRASEVKPKLDKFIIKQLTKNKITIPDAWYIDPERDQDGNVVKPALSYKMQILSAQAGEKFCFGKNKDKDKDNEDYQICGSYFGNMGSNKQRLAVMYDGGITLKMIVVNADLRKQIDKYIIPFFLVHNFGTRQSKGFGSFVISHKNEKKLNYRVRDELRNYAPDSFYVEHPTYTMGSSYKDYLRKGKKTDPRLEDVKLIYALMKGGVNITKSWNQKEGKGTEKYYFRGFVFQYFNRIKQGLKFSNDKAFIKQKVLTHHYSGSTKGEKGSNHKFCRALLGLSDRFNYIKKDDGVKLIDVVVYQYNGNFNKDTKKNTIERFASPILFKVVDGAIFILPQSDCFEGEDTILDKKFYFQTTKTRPGFLPTRGEIFTPDCFDLNDFIKKFIDHFNDKDKPWGGGNTRKLSDADKSFNRIKTCEYQFEPVRGGKENAAN
jgi:hypothetical protein